MNFYATLNKSDNSISSIMSTTHLDSAYAVKNGLVEVSSEDAAIIEKYLPTHDIILDSVEGLMVYERIGQKVDNAKTQLKTMLTSAINAGFVFEDQVFSCSIYDQINVYHFENNMQSRYSTVNDDLVYVPKDKLGLFKKAMASHVFSLYRSHLGFKSKLEQCSTFKDVDVIVNSARIFYDAFKKSKNAQVEEYLASTVSPTVLTTTLPVTQTPVPKVETTVSPSLPPVVEAISTVPAQLEVELTSTVSPTISTAPIELPI
jgi:hypothetical protein